MRGEPMYQNKLVETAEQQQIKEFRHLIEEMVPEIREHKMWNYAPEKEGTRGFEIFQRKHPDITQGQTLNNLTATARQMPNAPR